VSSKKQVIADTGYFVACFKDNDAYNKQIVEWEARFGDEYILLTTSFVILEAYQIILKANFRKAREFMGCIDEGDMVRVISLSEDWVKKATRVMDRFSDKKLDLADVSLVLLADFIKIGDVLTVDRKDFQYLRWHEGSKGFNNLLDKL